MYILAIDFGTSSVKMSVLDYSNNIIASSKYDYSYKIYNNDWIELSGDKIDESLNIGLEPLKKYLDKVEVITYDTFSPSMVFLDFEGNLLHNIITHLDRRSKKETEYILNKIGRKEFQKITGIQPFTGGASVTTLLWFKENRPEIYSKAEYISHLTTYIYKKLTGVWMCDPVNASMTGLYNTITDRGWSDTLCTELEIDINKLPEIIEVGEAAGSLICRDLISLGLRPGIPVLTGSNDMAVAQLGSGNNKAGDILNTAGSSDMISILVDKPVINDKYYLRKSVKNGLWQIYAITAGGFAIDWFKNQFCREMNDDYFYNNYMQEILKKNPDDSSEILFEPYLSGDRQSLTPKRASFSGLTLQSSRDDMFLSLCVNMQKTLYDVFELASSIVEISGDFKTTGGLASSFSELKEKIFRRKISVFDDCPIHGCGSLALKYLNKE